MSQFAIFSLIIIITGIGVTAHYTFGYPILYYEEISSIAAKYCLDEELVYSIVWTESKFDKNAKSARGAVGLMQLMPSTAEWCCKMAKKKYEYEKLTDPRFNIELGCYYYAYLLGKFHNDYIALAAYNAGEGNVSAWLESDGKIKFSETEKYVDIVMRVRLLYDKKLSKYNKNAQIKYYVTHNSSIIFGIAQNSFTFDEQFFFNGRGF